MQRGMHVKMLTGYPDWEAEANTRIPPAGRLRCPITLAVIESSMPFISSNLLLIFLHIENGRGFSRTQILLVEKHHYHKIGV